MRNEEFEDVWKKEFNEYHAKMSKELEKLEALEAELSEAKNELTEIIDQLHTKKGESLKDEITKKGRDALKRYKRLFEQYKQESIELYQELIELKKSHDEDLKY